MSSRDAVGIDIAHVGNDNKSYISLSTLLKLQFETKSNQIKYIQCNKEMNLGWVHWTRNSKGKEQDQLVGM